MNSSRRQEIKGEVSQLIETRRDFFEKNKNAYNRYNILSLHIPDEQKRAEKLATTDQRELLSLISSLNPDSISDENNDTYQKIQQKIKESKEHHDKSRTVLAKLEDEFYPLKKLFESFEEKYNGEMQSLIAHKYATFWKEKASRPRLFFDAIERNNLEELQKLYRPTFETRTSQSGYTPLTLAIVKGRTDMVRWLLSNGHADPNLAINLGKSFQGITPLCAAVIWENPEEKPLADEMDMIATLITCGAEIHKPSTTSLFTPLHWAAFTGSKKCIKSLLEQGADIHKTDPARNTPFAIFSANHKDKKDYEEIKALLNPQPKVEKSAPRRKWF